MPMFGIFFMFLLYCVERLIAGISSNEKRRQTRQVLKISWEEVSLLLKEGVFFGEFICGTYDEYHDQPDGTILTQTNSGLYGGNVEKQGNCFGLQVFCWAKIK